MLPRLAARGEASSPAELAGARDELAAILPRLSPRQVRIAGRVAAGYSQAEVAAELGLDARTVRRERAEMRRVAGKVRLE